MGEPAIHVRGARVQRRTPRSWPFRRPGPGRRPADRERGQSLAEFAILAPLFMLVVIGLIEFSFALNAALNTNYASRAGGLIAAQAGNVAAADCLILNAIEGVYNAPADEQRIARVDVQRTNPSGATVYGATSYGRGGSLTCTRADGSRMTVPYRRISNGYPASQRCNVLPPYGCPTLAPPRTTVDTVAVQITYTYSWQTPLGSLMGMFGGSLSGSGMSYVSRNAFRMEPIL